MIDTHCHLTHERFAGDLDAVVGRARDTGIEACITVGTGLDDARAALELARRYPGFIACSAGIDPFTAHELGDDFDRDMDGLRAVASSEPIVAIGEIGLDYHYDLADHATQKRQLSRQIALAVELDLPIIIHVRDAHADMIQLLSSFPRARGVIHSFTGSATDAERYVDLGWYVAFNGIVTFANAEPLRQAVAVVPDDRLLVETDSPYLAPVPRRGKRCEPAFASHTIAKLAELRHEDLAATVALTTQNAARLFRLPRLSAH